MTAASDASPLVLEGATLLDGSGAPPRQDAVVIIDGARVAQVGRVGELAAPVGASVENLRGKYLIPGLIDAHAHAEEDWVLAAMLAMGITQLRNPARTAATGSIRDGKDSDALLRPGVIAAGVAIDAPGSAALGAVEVRDEAEIRMQVQEQVEAGAELIKLYTGLTPELVRAGTDQAHALGVKAIGDLAKTSWTEAARAGIDFLAHAAPRHASLLPPAARSEFERDVAARRVHPIWRWYELVDLDGAEIREMIDTLAEHSVVVDPTLVTLEAMRFADDPSYGACPLWRKLLELVRRLHEGGVTLIAGTDTPRPWVVPGASLHRELALLIDAGLTPAEALSAATGRSAAALGLSDRLGTVAPGQRADLLLLDDDPLSSIANTLSIRWVMRAGLRCRPSELRNQYD